MSTAILGGGLSGLSAAYYLLKKYPGNPVKLIEASSRLGGWIRSNSLENDVIFEEGPRTIRPAANTLSLIEEVGLKDEVTPVYLSAPAARNRMIYANGKLHLLPNSLSSILKTLPPFSKPLVSYLMQDIFAAKKNVEDESIYDFTSRRFGKDIADYLISPLICGICAGDSKKISVNFLMSSLFEYEQKYGNVYKGLLRKVFSKTSPAPVLSSLALKAKEEKWSVFSFKHGLETLPKALETEIRKSNVSIITNNKCDVLEISPGNVTLKLQNGEIINTSQVISSISSEKLGKVLQKQHPDLSKLLQNIENVTVAVINLQFNNKLITNPGFGFLVPPKEKLPILGVIYDSCCFPKDDQSTILTVMMGGAWFEQLFGKNPEEEFLLNTALEQLKLTMGINELPVEYKVSILRKCIPQYTIGHRENLEKINKYIKQNELPLYLCGSSYIGVGVNDVILSSKNVVETL